MKIGLVSMLGNVGTTFNSQGGGYGLINTKIIKDFHVNDEVDVNPDPFIWGQYDKLYICEGVNFVEGSFNIPGGPQKIHYDKMAAMSVYEGKIEFVNKGFDFEAFNKRIGIENPNWPAGLITNWLIKAGEDSRKCVIGDSHALSIWQPGYGLNFTPGRTLHGFLKRENTDVINYVYDETITYFGNIDIRFHLYRQENSEQATRDLIKCYIDFSNRLTDNTIVEPLPIEHESRKIPGTGLYKGQPFFGSRSERMAIRDIVIDEIRNSGVKYISWPTEWADNDGTKMLDILESKQSVHIKPKYYQHIDKICL